MSQSFKRGFRPLLPTCRDATRIQADALRTKLFFAQKLGLWLHLLVCKWCRRYGRQVRFLHDAAHTHSNELTETIPQKLGAEARERIKQRLQSEK